MTEETGKKEHEKPLEKLTVKELREIALALPHSTAIHDLKKEDLVAFIKEARGVKEEVPHKAKKKVAVKVKLGKAEIKARIRELKDQKRQAQEGKEGKKAKALRRVISRLKKKSREAA